MGARKVGDVVAVCPFTSHAVVHAGVARVTLAGELDLDTAPLVRDAVVACLAEQPASLCLDLTDLSFCDCAGLGVLLRARMSALQAGVPLVVEGMGTQPARLLALIGGEDIFTQRTPERESTPETDMEPGWETGAEPHKEPDPGPADGLSTTDSEHLDAEAEATLWPPVRDLLA
ncbi:STAS domain-containing protein [Streptomyces sp. NPDC048361]|uniref:STAS domain-containing protein n=1 Tax=Streptomyces sp. NPDC048361 TaxID=3154720 RepID=UPI00343719B3